MVLLFLIPRSLLRGASLVCKTIVLRRKTRILGEKGMYFELAWMCRQGVEGTSICAGTYWIQMIDSFTLSLIFEAGNCAR
jgi:hypothetical protein